MRRCYTGRNTQHTIVLPWLELLLLGRKVWFICLDIIHLSKIIIPPHRSTYVCTYILGAYDGMWRGVVTIWSPMDGGADRHRIQRIRWLQRRQLQLGHDVRRRIRAEPKGSVWNPIWLMANGVSRKINLFRSGAPSPFTTLWNWENSLPISTATQGECGPTSGSSVLVGKRVFFIRVLQLFFFWRLADTLASFFLASSTGTPSFSTCCAVLVIVLVLVPIFLIFLQQEIGHRGEIWGKCNEMGPFQARFSKAMAGWLSRVCRGHLCCRFFGGG